MRRVMGDSRESSRTVSASEYFSEYKGHLIQHLEKVLPTIRQGSNGSEATKRPVIFLAGDSSLDNKHWLYTEPKYQESSIHNPGFTAPACNGYENALKPPRMVKDVSYFMNLEANNQNIDYVTINTSIEESTLSDRGEWGDKLRPQDKFIRDNITEDDILVVSVGGNDIALKPTICTGLHIFSGVRCIPQCCIEYCGCGCCVVDCGCPGFCYDCCTCPCFLGHFINLFRNKVQRYVSNLISVTKPKRVVVCMIYYLDEKENGSWADETLSLLQYNTNPDKLQSIIRLVYKTATQRLNIPETEVVAFPLFQVLDSKDTNDYDNRVEPSIQGGEKMGKALLQAAISSKTVYPASKKIY